MHAMGIPRNLSGRGKEDAQKISICVVVGLPEYYFFKGLRFM